MESTVGEASDVAQKSISPTTTDGSRQAKATPSGATPRRRKWLIVSMVTVVGIAAYVGWAWLQPPKLPAGFASSNGRLEATEIDIAAKLGGRILNMVADEGDFLSAGQVVAQMDVESLEAQRREAVAKLSMTRISVETAQSTLAQRESEKAAADSVVAQRQSDLDLSLKRFERAQRLIGKGGISQEQFDSHESGFHAAKAALSSARANALAAEAAVSTAKSSIISAESNVTYAQATVERIQADIADSTLKAPRAGRVQYRIAQPGEVVSPGGKVMNMIDLNDVYMTFFLPEASAGRVKLGAEVRIVLDAAPELVIPAKVTFVADVAQFTPKTVETAEERQKLTFRLKAHIDKELVRKYAPGDQEVILKYAHVIKTGLPGVAFVRLAPKAPWPARLEVRLPP